jgi:chromosome partitioning protein
MAKVIAISSQKGGVGKTTTTVNLAASFATMGMKTLVIDLDEQSAVSIGLGLPPEKTEFGIYDILAGTRRLKDVIHASHIASLKVIPSGKATTAKKKKELLMSLQTPDILRGIVRAIYKSCDIILMDCPPGMGNVAMNALSAAELVIVPLQCEPLALKTLTQILKSIRQVRQTTNPGLKMGGLLLTMFDDRYSLANQISSQVREIFPSDAVYQTVIPRHEDLSYGFATGKPIVLENPESEAAKVYMQLAREVLKKARDSK